MKRFLYIFLGTMAGIWVSVLLGGVLLLLTIGALVASDAPNEDSIKDGSVLYLPLSGEVADRATSQSLMEVLRASGEQPLSLAAITASLRRAKTDDRIKGAFIEIGDLALGLAQCDELRTAIADFRSDGKWVWVYSDNYTQTDFLLATACDRVIINPIGMIDIHGLSATTFYMKDLLEKVGVEMQVVKVGTYKSAVEPFLMNEMSEANREQLKHFLGRMWDNVKGTIAGDLEVAADSVDRWADSFIFNSPAEEYKKLGMVDELLYRTEVDAKILAMDGVKATEDDDDEARTPRYVAYDDYMAAMTGANLFTPDKGSHRVAILYAEGDITEDADDGIASTRLVAQINDIADNEKIEALILRVNSGGGSAFASEQIWKALTEYKSMTGNPVYVSMGDMAASGGYYISCCADKIFASPLTLTGSIGIYGMIPNAQPLMKDKLGVNAVTVATNTGRFPDLFEPMTPEQRNAMQEYVDRGYELFVKRCADGRHLTVEQIKAVAEGRVWDGTSALENGLIDALGGLSETMDALAADMGLTRSDLNIVEYPVVTPKWWEPLLTLEEQAQALAASGSLANIDATLYNAFMRRLRAMNPIQARADIIYVR